MAIDSWTSSIDWKTPAGLALQRLATAVPSDRRLTITVFGSAPLQLMLDPSLLSADVDVFCEEADLNALVRIAGLDRAHSDFHIQVGSELSFRTSPRWRARAQTVTIGACTFLLPHPVDILIGKLHRLDAKDLEAFRVVRQRTGHPSESELISELQFAVDLFRPSFDEERAVDFAGNVRRLWPQLYHREIDPRAEIVLPALANREAGYGAPPPDHKRNLRS